MEEKARVIAILADEFIKNHPLAEKLRENGFRVEIINREQANCDNLAALNPSIIITDADERNAANPFHLINKIRGDERLKSAEIFFYSTSIDVKTEITLRKLKVNAFFIKSGNVDYMVEAAHTHFKGFEIIPGGNVSEEILDMDDLDDNDAQIYPVERPPVSSRGAPASSPADAPAGNVPGPGAKKVETTDEFTTLFADLVDDSGDGRGDDESQFEKSYNLGVSLYDKELYEKAVAEFDKASQSPAWRVKSLLMTGMALKKMGELDKAVGIFKTGYRDSPDESGKAEFLYELGDTLDAIGKMDEAYKMFAAVYQRNKEFRDVRARLVSLKSAIEIRNKS